MKIKNIIKDFINTNWKSLIVIFIIPVLLYFIFLLPSSLKEILILNRDYSKIYDIYTTHFIHEDLIHLTGNIVGYLVFTLPLYFLLYTMNMKKLFIFFLLFNLTITPILLSIIWIQINISKLPQIFRTFGFSGINSAFLGMLAYSYALFLHKKLGVEFSDILLATLLLGIGIIPLTYYHYIRNIEGFIIILIVWILFGIFLYKIRKELNAEKIKNLFVDMKKSSILIIVLPPIIYLIGIISNFPKEIVFQMSVINIVLHYFGIIIGFISGLFFTLFTILKNNSLKKFISQIIFIINIFKNF